MEGKDGVSTAAEIRREDQDAVIIFITNMAQMAIQGYSVQALDFVLKPVSYYSFAMKMRSAVQIVSSRQSRKTRKIMVNTSGGIQVISSDRLYFIEVERHYLYYHTPDGVFRQKAALKDLENNFNGLSFVRCNNCYLVNLKYVECVDKDNVKVGGTWLRISRPRKKAFLQAITCYMGGINL